MDFKIRNANINDFSGTLRLFKQLWPDKDFNHDKLREIYEKSLHSDKYEILCAEISEKIVGVCSFVFLDNF